MQSVEDFQWHKLRRVIEELPAQLLKFSDKHFGEAALHEAWDEFTDRGASNLILKRPI